ncbi:MAG: thiolase family protein [Gammaproteobacteria bacterium]|nr:thiolase family protein [Gammaproteobacteria bacterium]
MTSPHDCVIVAAKRSPIGGLMGVLAPLSAPQLAAQVHQATLADLPVDPKHLDEVIMGCVLQAGIGQAPARQSAIFAGIPDSVGATTLNKMCGSGMKAVMVAYDELKLGSASLLLAGGMESMSQSPYLLKKARQGYRLGHGQLQDHLFLDGLEDAYEPGKLMGCFADDTAAHFHFSREAQDEFARCSMTRALQSQQEGRWVQEIAPISVPGPKNTSTLISLDEHPASAKLDKIASLKPSFSPEGTVTPASSSAISDGAASLMLTTRQYADKHHLPILATIVAHASHAQAPQWFTTAPVGAIQALLKKANWELNEVDVFEINEAFAVVVMASMHLLKLSHDIVNIGGGACALGHPIGASGARIIVTLLHTMIQQDLKKGVAAVCIGGGEATAIALERS